MNRIVESLNGLKSEDLFVWKCIFYVFKVFGIASMSLKVKARNDRLDKRYEFSYSLTNIAYNALLVIALIVSNCLATRGYELDQSNEVMYLYASDVVSFLSAISIVVIFCTKCRKHIVIWNRMMDIGNDIEDHWDNRVKNGVFRKVNVAFSTYALNWLAMTISASFYRAEYVVFCLNLNACHFVISSVALQYCVVLEILKYLFAKLNENLIRYAERVDSTRHERLRPSIDQIEDELSRLWELYAKLNKVSREVSSFYSMSMLLIATNAFLMPTTLIYVIIAKPIVVTESSYLILNDYVCGIFATFVYLWSIVLLTSSVTATTNESQRTREIVSAQLRKSESRQIREKLHQFSISMLYEAVEFTVFDFFSLNGSLLVSIVATATTYLVILLQFHSKYCPSQR